MRMPRRRLIQVNDDEDRSSQRLKKTEEATLDNDFRPTKSEEYETKLD